MEEYLRKVKMLVDDLDRKEIKLPGQVVMSWVLYHLTDEYAGITQALRYNITALILKCRYLLGVIASSGKDP